MVQEADVHLSVARNPRVPQQTAEVTVFANGTVIRAQERSENLYASIDLVANKLARQLRKYKERHNTHNAHNNKSTKSIQNEGAQNYSSSDNPLIDGKEGRKTLAIIRAIYTSDKTGKPVKRFAPKDEPESLKKEIEELLGH